MLNAIMKPSCCLFFFAILLIFFNGTVTGQNLQDGLIAYFPFTGNANDQSGNANNGTVSGATLTTDRFGAANSAYNFNGSSSYIMLPLSPLFNFKKTDAYTLSIWVQPASGSDVRSAVVRSPYNSIYQNSQWTYGICVTDNYQASIGYHDNFVLKSNTSMNPNETCWYLITSTYTNGKWKLYINGKLEKEDDSQTKFILEDATAQIAFGKKGLSNGDYYVGKIDDARLYNRVLTDEEVAVLYARETPCTSLVTTPVPTACDNWLYVNENVNNIGADLGDLDVSGNTITVEALFNQVTAFSPSAGTGDIVSKHQTPSDINYLLRNDRAEITTTNGYFSAKSNCGNDLNKTYHVAMVYDGTKLKLYKNGYLMAETACTGNLYQNDFHTLIGGVYQFENGVESFKGYINEVRIWKVARTQQQIKDNMAVSLVNPSAQTGLVAYYTFDNLKNKQGNVTWNATLNASATINKVNPVCEVSTDSCNVDVSAPVATGCNNWLYTNQQVNNTGVDIGDLDVSGNVITVEGLFNQVTAFTSPQETADIVSKHYGAQDLNYLLRNDRAEISTSNGYFKAQATCNNDLNKTYHVALVYDGAKLKFYKNGFLMAETPCTGNMLQNDWHTMIGGVSTFQANNESFPGYINEVRIWKVARTQQQIRDNMAVSLVNPSAQTGLVAYYTFDDLKNKQGNTAWNGTLTATAAINKTNPVCDVSTDSCPEVAPVVVAAGFTAPDTICVNTPYKVTNTSQNASVYYWNFNAADVNKTPQAVNLGNPGNVLVKPTFTDVIESDGNYYVFTTCHQPAGLVRLDFGNSLLNTPAVVNLGTLGGKLTTEAEGLQVVNNEGEWYVFIVGGSPEYITPYLIKVELGTSITNTSPVVTNYGAIGGLNLPIDLYMFKEGSDWYGLTVNSNTSTVTQFSFTSSFNNTPVATNLGTLNNQMESPTGIFCFKENNNWYAFVTDDANSQGLTRLSFGNSLTNTPTATRLPDQPSLNHIRDIYIMSYCDGIYGFAVNGTTNELLKLDFGSSVTNNPVVTNYGNIGNFNFPHSLSKIFRVGGDLYSFITNVNNNTITRVRFSSATVLAGSTSASAAPGNFTYNTPGTYNINLVVDEGLSTQTSYCKSVTVLDYPKVQLMADTIVCGNTAFLLRADSLQYTDSIRWTPSTGLSSDTATSPQALLTQTAQYKLTAYNAFCSSADSVLITVNPVPVLTLTNDTAVCKGAPLVLAVSGADSYAWTPDASITDVTATTQSLIADTTLKLLVKGSYATTGCSSTDSVFIDVVTYPTVALMGDTTICEDDVFKMRAVTLNYTDSTRWTPAAGLSSDTAALPLVSPSFTTTYVLTAYNRFCTASDEVQVTVNVRPVITISNDTTICRGDQITVFASGAASYSWKPSVDILNVQTGQPTVNPSVSTTYTVTGTGSNGCTQKDSVLINVQAPEVFSLEPKVRQICAGDSITLMAAGADAYQWLATDIGTQSSTAGTISFAPVNQGAYSVIAFDNVCRRSDTLSAVITIHALPVLTLAKSNDIDCVVGAANLSVYGASIYHWFPSGTLSDARAYNPVVKTDTSTYYHVIGTDFYGCASEDSILVLVNKNNFNAYPIATAFTPNGDGLNDCFRINKWGFIHSMELVIYNRIGERVFATSNPDECWDGTFKGERQLPGTYVYTIKAQTLCGTVTRNGTVVLIR